MNRLHNLDYLRGIAALSIMIYHYSLWTFGKFGAESFIGRIGVYGVSVFYVLSGLTLFYVYHDRMKPSPADLKAFAKKKIFSHIPTSLACSGVPIPNPTHTGTEVCSRT